MFEISCMRSWLPFISLNSVIYGDLSSFQVYIELSLSSNVHVQDIGTEKFCLQSLKKTLILEL